MTSANVVRLKITSGPVAATKASESTELPTVLRRDSLLIEGSGIAHRWTTKAGEEAYLFGHLVGICHSGTISPASVIYADTELLENPLRIPKVEGRFVVVKVSHRGACEIWTDQFGRVDLYWQQMNDTLILGTGLDLLPIAKTGGPFDPIGVAHALTVYGGRPARQHTLYRDCHRLGIDQGIRLTDGKLVTLSRPFHAAPIAAYTQRDLHRYADMFLEGIRARTSENGNIVSLSSGWDSTSILAALVHLVGRSKVRAVIGRLTYSGRSGIVNQFELDRAKAVADYFGVRLDTVDVDYRADTAAVFEAANGLLRSQQLASLTALGQWRIAAAVAKTYAGETFFTGECSDGAHNFGFSQYVTLFHRASFEFREYADKMASYLFGPTFLSQLLEGTHEDDPVWQFFRQRNPSTKFDAIGKDKTAITRQMLSSFFLTAGRMPLYSLDNAPLLTASGRETFRQESERTYLQDAVADTDPSNIYAWYLHLYHSFHWQAATVISRDYTAEAHGIRCAHPFQDSQLLEFLSSMPESFGRGLDFNPTKYPLKWMLRNRIDYPYHLQVGPHSYTYDMNPNFSLLGELLHASGLTELFKRSIRAGAFVGKLDPAMFDHSYIDRIVKSYLAGDELRGAELGDLGVLAVHAVVGVYGESVVSG